MAAKRKDITDEIAVEAYQRLGTLEAAGDELGVSRDVIRNRIRKHIVIQDRRQRPDITDEMIVEAYRRLKSTPKVAEELGISDRSVLRRLRKVGEPRFPSGASPIIDDATLIQHYRMTGSADQVSQCTGLNSAGIRARLNKLGIELTGNSRRSPYTKMARG